MIFGFKGFMYSVRDGVLFLLWSAVDKSDYYYYYSEGYNRETFVFLKG